MKQGDQQFECFARFSWFKIEHLKKKVLRDVLKCSDVKRKIVSFDMLGLVLTSLGRIDSLSLLLSLYRILHDRPSSGVCDRGQFWGWDNRRVNLVNWIIRVVFVRNNTSKTRLRKPFCAINCYKLLVLDELRKQFESLISLLSFTTPR